MPTEKVFWRSKYTIIVDEQQADGIHVLKMADGKGKPLYYDKNAQEMRWQYTGQNYSLLQVEIAILKNMIRHCTDERLFDFSNYKCDIAALWCEYLEQKKCSTVYKLKNALPWPFVPAIIKLLLEEIYEENEA